jgi:hypothetical protein
MRKSNIFPWLALLVAACAVPDVKIVDSLDGASGDATVDDGGGPNEGGTKGDGKSGSGNNPGASGDDDGGGTGATPSVGGSSSPTGGRPSGGSGASPSGGSSPAGGSNPSGGSGGSGPLPPGAVAKFCNNVTVAGALTDFVLRIGTGSSQASIVATSGECAPVQYDDCAGVPTGEDLPFTVEDLAGMEWWGGMLTISPGEAWIFGFDYDTDAQELAFAGVSEGITELECAAASFEDVFPSGPTPP